MMTALLLVRVSLLLTIALAAGRLFRRASGRTRHAVWTAAFAAMLVLPALPYMLPALDVPVPERWRSASPASSSNSEIVRATPLPVNANPQTLRDESVVLPSAPTTRPVQTVRWFVNIQPRSLLIPVWAFGTWVALALLAVSLLRVRALDGSARPCADEEWERAAASIAARAGATVPRLRVSDRIDTPMAGGLTRPTIYLPASAARWPAERRDIVLAHELAHLARRDPLRHIAARAAVALYWFHPLAWVAAADASIAREQACDEAVLALGTRPSSYAQVLLDFAESQASPLRSLAALPIVERSLLEHRLMAILAHDSGGSRPRPLIAAFTIAMVALALGAARPSAAVRSSQLAVSGLRSAVSSSQLAVSGSQTTGTLSCNIDPRGWLQKSYSISTAGGERVVNYDMIGTSGAGRVILKSFKDLQVCMVAQGAAGDDERLQPSEWTRRAQQTIIEARQGNRVQRLELTREGGGQGVSGTIDGKEQPFDSAAQDWRERMLAVLDTTWEISRLHGEVSTLRGEISSLRGQESSLQGEISTLRGQVSSLRGQISSVHGDESSLRGEISSIQGHVSSLQGLISSEQGSISSLEATRSFASDAERGRIATRVREHEAEIARVEKAIRDYNAEAKIAEVERRLRDLNGQNQVEAIESQIRSLSTDGKIAELEKRIRDLDVEGKRQGIEHHIDALNAGTRTRALEERRDQELKDLLAAIARIR